MEKKDKIKRILITGGAGFIGSHLCERLSNNGHIIYCIDNLVSGNSENISHLLKKDNFKFYEFDIINDFIEIDDEIDEIYHLASPASPKDYQDRPLETALANSLGTLNLLKLAVKKKAKFLFASTSEIYGNPEQHPQSEEYNGAVNPLSERACYAESKRFGKTLVSIFRRKHKLDAKIARIFNTYGPRMRYDDGRVIPTFIWKALHNEDIPIHGNGKQTRSFCYIDDIVEGLIKMMESNHCGPINLGNPNEEITILSLAQKIKELTKSDSKFVFLPAISDDPIKRKPDISKAKNLLNWEPKCSLECGLRITIQYYKKHGGRIK